jgi:hypothetical protein
MCRPSTSDQLSEGSETGPCLKVLSCLATAVLQLNRRTHAIMGVLTFPGGNRCKPLNWERGFLYSTQSLLSDYLLLSHLSAKKETWHGHRTEKRAKSKLGSF